jgi:hypothetical protein
MESISVPSPPPLVRAIPVLQQPPKQRETKSSFIHETSEPQHDYQECNKFFDDCSSEVSSMESDEDLEDSKTKAGIFLLLQNIVWNRTGGDTDEVVEGLLFLVQKGAMNVLKDHSYDCFRIALHAMQKHHNAKPREWSKIIQAALCLLTDTYDVYNDRRHLLIQKLLQIMRQAEASKLEKTEQWKIHKLASILIDYVMQKYGHQEATFICFSQEGGVELFLRSYHKFRLEFTLNTLKCMVKIAKQHLEKCDNGTVTETLMLVHVRLLLFRIREEET